VVCQRCRTRLNVLAKGRWIASAPGNTWGHGYKLNRLYSPWVKLADMIEASQSTTPWGMQEFQNSDLGEAFLLPNGGLNPDELDRCLADYSMSDYHGQECVMGVDIGGKFHYVIREAAPRPGRLLTTPTTSALASKLWAVGTVDHFGQLEDLMNKFHVVACNIDLRPETHAAVEFARTSRHKVYLTDYDRHEPGHVLEKATLRRIRANRTDVMDEVVDRFRKKQVSLPRDGRYLAGRIKHNLGEYYRQVLAPKRTIDRASGRARWVETGDDHFFHAEVYCQLAEAHRSSGRIEFW
jgi:hypothetical protein